MPAGRESRAIGRGLAAALVDQCGRVGVEATVSLFPTYLDAEDAVADESRVGNFSRGDEAYFWQKLGRALPGVLDFTLAASREQRAQLAAALRNVAAFDHHRRAVGARPIAVEIVEPIDWASLLRYSIFASRRDLNVLRGVVDGMVRADPRLRREAENVRAPIRVATRIQRAWRARRRLKGDASASSP